MKYYVLKNLDGHYWSDSKRRLYGDGDWVDTFCDVTVYDSIEEEYTNAVWQEISIVEIGSPTKPLPVDDILFELV